MIAAILPLQLRDLPANAAALADRLDGIDPEMERQVPMFRERIFARNRRVDSGTASVQ